MSETVVRVDLRQATLSENARLREAGELLFLAIENPPPVRSLLKLGTGDDVEAFEVTRVIEVVDEVELARGCYGRRIELERLAEQTRVGSEHLEPNSSAGGGGVPAPVMMFGDSQELRYGDSGPVSEAGSMGDEDSDSESESSDRDPESESSDPESESSDPESGSDEHSDDESE